jgi:hypothetical protein
MAVELRIEGADQLLRLAAELKAAGRADLKREMLRGFRAETAPIIADIHASASRILPHRGGLSDRVAADRVTAVTRTTGSGVGIRIKGVGKENLRRIDAGLVRHMLFGNRSFWYGQNVRAGWFTHPILVHLPSLQRQLIAAMDRTAVKLRRS